MPPSLSDPQLDLGEEAGPRVSGVHWDVFSQWWADVWEPGQHVALIGPTGVGKTTFAVPILRMRKYVLALDPKGGDSSLAKSGFERITSWPPPDKVRKGIAEGRPARLIVGAVVKRLDERPALKALQKKVLGAAFDEGGWTVYLDEFQLAADRRMMGLHIESETLLIAARDKGISVVTSYQAPAWVPTAASRQATWIVVWPTRDDDVIKKLSAIVGRPRQEIASALHALPPHHVLVVGLDSRAPMVITKAPRL